MNPPVTATDHFDRQAAQWDDNPVRQALSSALAEAIRREVPLRRDWSALEYGCGTATLSFLLSGDLGRILVADNSPGMLEQVRRKLDAAGVRHLEPRLLDLTCDPPPEERFDLVMCAMAVHHVVDVKGLLKALADLLNLGGWLAIADLETEDGSFHTDTTVPHHGFDPGLLAGTLTAAGLTGARWRTAHTIRRNERPYPVFLLTARRLPVD